MRCVGIAYPLDSAVGWRSESHARPNNSTRALPTESCVHISLFTRQPLTTCLADIIAAARPLLLLSPVQHYQYTPQSHHATIYTAIARLLLSAACLHCSRQICTANLRLTPPAKSLPTLANAQIARRLVPVRAVLRTIANPPRPSAASGRPVHTTESGYFLRLSPPSAIRTSPPARMSSI